MNHIYRVIFNRHTNTHQAVSEIAKGCGKTNTNKSSAIKRLLLSPLALAMALLSMVSHAAPTGGQVVAGTANIHQAGNITDIHQASQNAAINWQDFNINAQETVNFHQPNSQAVTLNRVLGHEKSVIDGMMNANGKVFIQNPNGTLIGKNAQINVGGLVATTAKISDEDFMQGNYRFVGGTGEISNLGQITVPKGGVIALIAPIVKNSGTITAHGADSLLASADSFSITLPDNTNFAYTLDKGTLQGLVDNGGAILADGGRVVLTTLGIDTVKKSLIKHSGIIEANSVRNNNGVIELLGDLDNSKLQLTGTLKAEGQGTDNGGFIETSAAKFDIADTAHVSTQSKQGKTGTWLIDPKDFTVAPSGGDTTGAKVSQGLQNNNVQLKSKDGAIEGKGDVIINDTISWNKNKLTLTADNDIHINKTLNATGTASLALEYGQATANGTVKVTKDGKTEWQDNDYYLQKDTPLASRTVKVNLPVGKTFSTKQGRNGEVEIYDVIHEMPKIVKNADGEWVSEFTTDKIAFGRDMDVSFTKNYEGFAGWILPNNSGKVHGLGHVVDGLWLRSKKNNQYTGLFQKKYGGGVLRDIGVTNVDIQSQGNYAYAGGLVGEGDNIHNSYATGTVSTTGYDADAGGLLGWGYNIHNSYATGTVSTAGENADAGGLVGVGDNIRNSYATGTVSTTGDGADAGGLAGYGSGIHNSYATGTVSTTGYDADAGGLVGRGGDIHNSYATGTVSTTGRNADAGGLVGSGYNIHNSYATGTVSTAGNHAHAGGLAGGGGNIHNSYATGSVSTTGDGADAGGLVGWGNTIHNSYATGTVSTTGRNADAGGLVGVGDNIHHSYADNSVSATGSNSHQGGIIGFYDYNKPSNNSFFNQDKNPSLQAIGEYDNSVDQSKITNLTGKTEAELKQKATFKDWDFDKVWRISEGSDTPRLRALTQGMITIGGKKLLIHGVLLSKRYNGEPILTYDELTSLEGWKENGVVAIGISLGDKLSDKSIFSGNLVLGGNWQGAVDAGDYDIIPSGLSSQKYEIEYKKGKLTILPIQLGVIGTRPYNATSIVQVDKNTTITGDILPKDKGKLIVSGSSQTAKEYPNRFEYVSDVGTYQLLGGDLKVSNKNYVVNPALSRWTITPKTIYLTGNANNNQVVASQVDLNQLGIESADKGKVSLIGQGTLNSQHKLTGNHSFRLTGSQAKNYVLNTSQAWTMDNNPKPITPPTNPITPPNTSDEKYAKELIDEAKKIRNLAGKDYAIAKAQGRFIDVQSLNRDIAIAKQKARIAINQIKTANIRDELLKQVDGITQLPALDWIVSGGGSSGGSGSYGGSSGGNTYTPPSVPNTPTQPITPTPSSNSDQVGGVSVPSLPPSTLRPVPRGDSKLDDLKIETYYDGFIEQSNTVWKKIYTVMYKGVSGAEINSFIKNGNIVVENGYPFPVEVAIYNSKTQSYNKFMVLSRDKSVSASGMGLGLDLIYGIVKLQYPNEFMGMLESSKGASSISFPVPEDFDHNTSIIYEINTPETQKVALNEIIVKSLVFSIKKSIDKMHIKNEKIKENIAKNLTNEFFSADMINKIHSIIDNLDQVEDKKKFIVNNIKDDIINFFIYKAYPIIFKELSKNSINASYADAVDAVDKLPGIRDVKNIVETFDPIFNTLMTAEHIVNPLFSGRKTVIKIEGVDKK